MTPPAVQMCYNMQIAKGRVLLLKLLHSLAPSIFLSSNQAQTQSLPVRACWSDFEGVSVTISGQQ